MKDLILLIVASHLLLLFLFLADKLIGNKPAQITVSYYLRAFLTSLAVLVILVGTAWLVNTIDFAAFRRLAPILSFVGACYVVKVILVGAPFEKSLWVTLAAWLLMYIADSIVNAAFNTSLWEGYF